MHSLLLSLSVGFMPTGDVGQDAAAFLLQHKRPGTAAHSRAVAAEAVSLAGRFGVDCQQAEIAAWLHDISAVLPGAQRAEAAQALGLALLPEEARFPPIAHQKLSAVIAEEIFAIRDPAILSAIGCHTTLKVGASPLDKLVFLADKIAWDQPGTPPYLEALLLALHGDGDPIRALDAASLVYLAYLWDRRADLPVVHPWMVEAYRELSGAGTE